jgi:hypothetical protein
MLNVDKVNIKFIVLDEVYNFAVKNFSFEFFLSVKYRIQDSKICG